MNIQTLLAVDWVFAQFDALLWIVVRCIYFDAMITQLNQPVSQIAAVCSTGCTT